ncbi:hypothetical protein MD484_g2813, partial [Candolleomyces efflorescens]
MKHGATHGPYDNYQHIFDTIDDIEQGDAPWMCMSVSLNEDLDESTPSWKKKEYEVWYRDPDTVLSNMLSNPDFNGQFDYQPYVEVDEKEQRRLSDFMSANVAWNHATRIFEDNNSTRGATYVPLILGSDKTTVSVATGDTEYHPLYLSIGNVHNNVRRAHRDAVVPVAFLAIPKAERKYDNDADFRRFKRQLYHASISAVFSSVAPHMSTPVVRQCPDAHYRRVIYDFAAFIADYPEQVMLAGTVQGWCPKCTAQPSNIDGAAGPRTNKLLDDLLEIDILSYQRLWDEYGFDASVVPFTRDFPRADIYEMLSSDLLHQVIKGTFKDHLVTWVEEFLSLTYEKSEANQIMDEIDRRLAAVPPFSGLRRFKQGRRFKQWTGDDSKALMKIYLSAIQGLLPREIVQCFAAFLDFCYLVRRNDIDTNTLTKIQSALQNFHLHREVFRRSGVREDGFSLPRQHSLVHYCNNIRNFGAPNGLCSSITESRHITAVKKPWRRSNRYEALGQMLLINQRLDKLAAARSYFTARGMLRPGLYPVLAALQSQAESDVGQANDGVDKDRDENEDEEDGVIDSERVLADVKLARTAHHVFADALSLSQELDIPTFPHILRIFLCEQLGTTVEEIEDYEEEEDILAYISPISTFRSAVATFFAPSDICGIRGMRREWLRSTPSWRNSGPSYEGTTYPCAVVEWFKKIGRAPDPDTGMWIVAPDMSSGERDVTVIHIDSILRAAHLLPVYGAEYPLIPPDFDYSFTLDAFNAYYVNKYIDHHANEIAF